MSGKTGHANRKLLWLIFALSAAPFVLATFFYQVWKPTPNSVGALLLPVKTLPKSTLQGLNGSAADLPKGKWVLLLATTSACDKTCQNTLYRMRQTRMAQGAEMLRLDRVWVSSQVQDAAFASASKEGVRVLLDTQSQLIAALPLGQENLQSAIYLVDPNHNLVMRYDAAVDPVKMIREITKIMKINNGLG